MTVMVTNAVTVIITLLVIKWKWCQLLSGDNQGCGYICSFVLPLVGYFFFQQVEECKIKTSRDLSVNYRLVLIKVLDTCSFVLPLVGIFLCPTGRRVKNKNFKRFVFYDHWWRHLQPLVEVLQANTSKSSRGQQHKRWTSFSQLPPSKIAPGW